MSESTATGVLGDPVSCRGWATASGLLSLPPTGPVEVYFDWKSQQRLCAGDREVAVSLAPRARRWFIGTAVIGGPIGPLVVLIVRKASAGKS